MDQILTFVMDHWPLCLAMVTLLAVASSFSEQTIDAMSPDALVHKINDDQAMLIDVRPEDAFAKSHIRGARSIPFSEQMSMKGIANEAPIVLVCQTGRVAEQARKQLSKLFPNLSILQGGLNAWIQDDLPTVSEASS